MKGPFKVSEKDFGVMGRGYEVTGPGDYQGVHGGGRDNGKARANLQAAELNRAYAAGYRDATDKIAGSK